MNNAKAFKAFTALHATRVAAGAPPLLADLDIGRGRGVHRRVAQERVAVQGPALLRSVFCDMPGGVSCRRSRQRPASPDA